MKGRSGTSATNTALVAGSVGALASGTGAVTVTNCPPEDKSFYCKLSRFVNIIKLFITIIVIVVAIIFVARFAYSYFKASPKGAKR